jgi:hypothetical protein
MLTALLHLKESSKKTKVSQTIQPPASAAVSEPSASSIANGGMKICSLHEYINIYAVHKIY